MSNKPLQPISKRKMELIFDFLNEGSFWKQGNQLLYPVDGKLQSVKVKAFQFFESEYNKRDKMFISEIESDIMLSLENKRSWLAIDGVDKRLIQITINDLIRKNDKFYIIGSRLLTLNIGY